MNKSKPNITEDFFLIEFTYPIILSIIAGFVFWLFFTYLPDRKRYKNIRPKIELNTFELYQSLFRLFNLVMSPNHYSSYYKQEDISSKNLTLQDLVTGLQNKVLNDTYLYYPEINDKLYVIGKELYESELDIKSQIEHLYKFSNYLKTNEILIFEKIRTTLTPYNLNNYQRSSISIVGSKQYRALNPSLTYLSTILFELYKHYIDLQNIVFKNDYTNQFIIAEKINQYYNLKKYKLCIRELNKKSLKYPYSKLSNDFFIFHILFETNKKKSYKLLDEILKSKPNLTSYRNRIDKFIQDKEIFNLVSKYYTSIEIEDYKRALRLDKNLYDNFIEQASYLNNFYNEKTKKHSSED